jgi:uncharacterized protein (TIGR02246 family)
MNTTSAAILGGCIIVAALIIVLLPRAVTKTAAAPDRQLLDKQWAALGEAFQRNDAQAWAAVYAEDAEYIGTTGEIAQGRAAIQKRWAQIFADNKGIKTSGLMTNERFLTPEIVLQDGTWQVTGQKVGTPSEGRYTTIWVYRNRQWLLVSHRDWIPIKQPEP